MPRPVKDRVGERVGTLEIYELYGVRPKRGAYWWCFCRACLKVKVIRGADLKPHLYKTCGCRRHVKTFGPYYRPRGRKKLPAPEYLITP